MECQERGEVTPRAWCLPNTIIYNSEGLTERSEREVRNGQRTETERGKQLLSLCLIKGWADFTNTNPHTHLTNC